MPEDNLYVDNELDRRVERFDSSWRRGDIPSIADFLSKERQELDDAQWLQLLKELVMIDLEYRWRRAADQVTGDCDAAMPSTQQQIPRQPHLEDYLTVYPELGPLERLSSELISSEYRARHRWGDRPSHQEYLQRFPDRERAVRRALERVDARLPQSSQSDRLRIRCPHCHDSIDVDDGNLGGNFICPSCNRRFSLVDDDRCVAPSCDVQRIGGIELLQRLASGSFGTVWKAKDTQLDRMVAVKIPHRGSFDATQRERFLREARAAAQLNHPNIIPVHEVGRDADRLYIVTDLVEGLNLADWLTEQRPTPREAAELCVKLANAVSHAHQQDVIHRDLKPSNIMLDSNGEPHLMDFGLAKHEAGEVTMTVEGKLLGTPAYMPPEQARGLAHEADCRSDVYSLGVILFELLTGERPFGGSTEVLLQRIMLEQATSPRRLSPSIPQDLETICLKCLEKDRHRRYQTAAELRDELQRFLRGEPVQARPITKAARTWRWCKRNPMLATLGATVGSLLLFLAVAGPLVAFSQTRLATKEATARGDLRRQLYVSDMNSALQAWETGSVRRVLSLLAKHRYSNEQEDLRQFEWYYLWRLCQGGLRTFDHGDAIYRAAISPDGNLLVTGDWDGGVKIWDLNSGKLLGARHGERWRASVAFSPDGTMLASGGGTLRLWHTRAQRLVDARRIDTDDVDCLAFSPDGKKLATGHRNGSIILWDIPTDGKIEHLNAHDEWVTSLAFTSDGKTLASSGEDDVVKLWSVEQDAIKFLKHHDKHRDNALFVAFSHDGRTLASTSLDGSVILWDMASNDTRPLLAPQGLALSVSYSSDGSMLAASFSGCIARIWDLPTYEEREPLKGHSGDIHSVVFSPNNILLTASFDGTAKLWDVATKEDRNTLKGHDQTVKALVFLPDGALVLGQRGWHLKDLGSGKWRGVKGQRRQDLLGRY